MKQYCAVMALPPTMHHTTDIVISAGLVGGAAMYMTGGEANIIASLNPILAFIGGIIGLFIGGVRVYEIIKEYFFTKKHDNHTY